MDFYVAQNINHTEGKTGFREKSLEFPPLKVNPNNKGVIKVVLAIVFHISSSHNFSVVVDHQGTNPSHKTIFDKFIQNKLCSGSKTLLRSEIQIGYGVKLSIYGRKQLENRGEIGHLKPRFMAAPKPFQNRVISTSAAESHILFNVDIIGYAGRRNKKVLLKLLLFFRAK